MQWPSLSFILLKSVCQCDVQSIKDSFTLLDFQHSPYLSVPPSRLIHIFPNIPDSSVVPRHSSHIPTPKRSLEFHFILTSLSPHLFNISICRRSTLWLPTWMWKSAALLCCPETGRRTAAWMCCPLIAPWPSWLRQKGRVTITSTLLSLTASTGRPLLSWPLTLCQAPQPTSGDWFSITAAQLWSCSTNSTSQTPPG